MTIFNARTIQQSTLVYTSYGIYAEYVDKFTAVLSSRVSRVWVTAYCYH